MVGLWTGEKELRPGQSRGICHNTDSLASRRGDGSHLDCASLAPDTKEPRSCYTARPSLGRKTAQRGHRPAMKNRAASDGQVCPNSLFRYRSCRHSRRGGVNNLWRNRRTGRCLISHKHCCRDSDDCDEKLPTRSNSLLNPCRLPAGFP